MAEDRITGPPLFDEVMDMKTRKGRSILYLLFNLVLYLVIGALFGAWLTFSARVRGSFGADFLSLIVLLVCLYAGILLHTIIHEGGHMVFGLLTGYGFVSFRVLRWTWVRKHGRLVVRKYFLPGTLGQCLLSPPKGYGDTADAPYVLYHLGGVLANLIVTAILMALTLLLPGLYGRIICTGFVLAGFVLACSNAIPNEPGKLNNDGRNLLELRRSADARRDMHKQLEMTALQANGMRMRDMPDALFEANAESAKTSMISSAVFAAQENRCMDLQQFDEAEALIELLSEQDLYLSSQIQKSILRIDRLYLRAISGEHPVPEKREQKLLKAYRALLPVCRTNYALALSEGDAKKAEEALSSFERLASDYPYTGELLAERSLVDLAKERIDAEG